MMALRALSHRNYRLFFTGQSISLIGTWMQQIAVNWLTFRLTNSAFLLGIVGFSSRIPTFLLAPLAGVLADRWDRHRILVFTQTLSMIQAFILAYLVTTERIVIWQIILLSLFLGLINAMDIPARQSFVRDMVETTEDLANAIALNSSMVNGARLVGPSLAGIIIAALGEGICFFMNGLSFIAVILSLLAMRINYAKRIESSKIRFGHSLREGFTYVFGFKPILYVLILLALVSLMGMPYMVLMPIFAKEILHGGPHTLGFLLAASGLGALMGAIYLSLRKGLMGLENIISIGSSLFGFGLIIFSLSRIFWFSMIFLILTGFGMMIQMTSSNTYLQAVTEEDKRGRVMSFYTMAFMGMVPFGSLLAGSLASKIGAQWTVMIGGIICISGSILFKKKIKLKKMVYGQFE